MIRMKNQLSKLKFLLFNCLSSCFLFFCVSLNAQSNQIDPIQKSSLNLKGLLSKVEVLRDQWGINHIYAQNEHDLFFAQGYCAVKDRLFQFEIWRRQATGTVAEIFGESELKRDIGTRLFKFRGNIKDELNHYHEDGYASCETKAIDVSKLNSAFEK